MNQHKPILTDAEIITIGHQARAIEAGENGYILPVSFARAIEQAILQSEQSQATEAYPCRIVETDFETDTVTLEMQGKYTVSSGQKYLCDVPLYRCPVPSSQVNLDSSNHIADMRKMVADMYWIDPDYPSYTSILDAFDPIHSAVEVEVGDQFEVSRAKTLPTLTIEVTELEENGDVKDFKVLSGDHIADAGKMIVPEGWRLVPVEPTEEMLKKAFPEIFDIDGISKNDLIERYQAMLTEAPKYTGDSNE